jgi:hypothetical protein
MNDILFTIGSVNPSGIGDEVYFIPKHGIRRWPTIQDDFEAEIRDGYTQYEGDFELHEGCCWNRLYNTQGKGSISWGYQGERDCKVVVNRAVFSYPKITNKVRAFAKLAANGDFVFIARHAGMYYVIGSPDYRATLTPNGGSGDAPGSAKGTVVEIQCPDTTPLPTYKGIVVLSDGILDCKTNTFINFEDMNTNKLVNYSDRIEEENSLRFEAIGRDGRIHIEGSGEIVMKVSVDGVTYNTVDHDVAFVEGVAEAPFQFFIGDKVLLTADTLTKVELNYNNVKNS